MHWSERHNRNSRTEGHCAKRNILKISIQTFKAKLASRKTEADPCDNFALQKSDARRHAKNKFSNLQTQATEKIKLEEEVVSIESQSREVESSNKTAPGYLQQRKRAGKLIDSNWQHRPASAENQAHCSGQQWMKENKICQETMHRRLIHGLVKQTHFCPVFTKWELFNTAKP